MNNRNNRRKYKDDTSIPTDQKELKELNSQQIKKLETRIITLLRPTFDNYNSTIVVKYVANEKKCKIIFYMNNTADPKTVTARKKAIKSQVKKAMDKIEIEIKQEINYLLEFKDAYENILRNETSIEVMDKVYKNMIPLIGSNLIINQWNNQKIYKGKLSIIRENLNHLIMRDLKDNFFDLCQKHQPLIDNPILLDCYELAEKNLITYANEMTNLLAIFSNRIKQYVIIITLTLDDRETTLVDFDLLVKTILNNQYSLHKKSGLLLTVKTLLEDSLEEFHLLLHKLNESLTQARAIKKAYENFVDVFAGISNNDILVIMGTTQFFYGFNVNKVAVTIKNYEINLNIVQQNLSALDRGISYVKKGLSNINILICESKKNIEMKRNNIIQYEILNEYQNEDGDNDERSENENTNESSSEKSLEEISITRSPCTLFSEPSLTTQVKRLALEKIKKAEEKQDIRKHRKKNEQTNLTLSGNENQQNDNDNFTIYLSHREETRVANIFPLAETKHLFLCCDMSFIKPNNADKLDAFQKTALLSKTLTRDSLGCNGIKIYGLDFLIVKCKAFPGEHLLCFPHRIGNTDHFVYVPAEIISHQKYEEYLNNRAALKQRASKEKEALVVSDIPSLPSQDKVIHHINRK